MLAIRTSASSGSFDRVKSTGRLMVRWANAGPFTMRNGRRNEQTPAFGDLSAGPEDDLIRLHGVPGSGGLFSQQELCLKQACLP